MDKGKNEQLLLNRIEILKNQMINIAILTGIDSIQTITCSQEIDELIILYMKQSLYKEEFSNCS